MSGPSPAAPSTARPSPGRIVLGVLLVLAGVAWLGEATGAFRVPWELVLPGALVATGLILVWLGLRGASSGGLVVLGEFDLALMAAERNPDFERFLHGVELVYAKLLDCLKAEGLERIEAMGKPFDPTEHEALMQTGEGEGEPVVADVLRQGYKLRGHVIRPAGVRVTRQ